MKLVKGIRGGTPLVPFFVSNGVVFGILPFIPLSSEEVSAMASKMTMIFNFGTFGWTESFYSLSNNLDTVEDVLRGLAAFRKDLGHPNAEIKFLRWGPVDQPNLTRFESAGLKAPPQDGADVPWNAVLARMTTATGRRRMQQFRGMKDLLFRNGALDPDGDFFAAAAGLKNYLIANSICIQTIDPANTLKDVSSVSSLGLVTTAVAHGLSPEQIVKFFRTYSIDGVLISGTFRVSTVPTATTFTVAGWDPDLVVTKGRVRRLSYIYDPINDVQYLRASKRDTGRPFALSRGRR